MLKIIKNITKYIRTPIEIAFLAITLFILLTSNCLGQSITWQHIFDYGSIKKIRHLNTGEYIFLSNKRIENQNKIYLGKLDNSGNLLWYKILGEGESSAYWIEQTNDNGFIIGGSIYTTSSVAYLLKTDSSGNELWHKTYSFSQLDQLRSVKQTDDRGYILSCRITMNNINGIKVIKIDSTGNLQWEKQISDNTYHYNSEEVEICNNGYLFIGSKYLNLVGSSDSYLLKINLSGDTLWSKTYGASGTDAFYSADILNGGFIIAGYSNSNNQHGESYLVKTDTNGILLWQKYYSGLYGEICYSVKHKQNYGFILAGYSDTFNVQDSRAFIKIVDTNGVLVNEKSFFPPNRGGVFYDVDLCNDGGYILGGFSNYNTAISMYAIKTDSTLFANPIGIALINQQIPKDFSLYQNYPNPFNPVTNIKFEIPKDVNVNFKIYDILGREVFSMNEYKKAGSYEVQFDGTNCASGMYFYKLETDGFSDTKKMVLLK